MKIAAIDLGSNSFHMVVVEVGVSGAFKVVAREKEMVRLGAGTLSRGRLGTRAVRRGLDTLRRYRRLTETHAVDEVVAVATSAIREAVDGEDFLEAVGTEIGVWPKAISGEEEARLIHLAALHSIHLEGKRCLVVDIGGGSVEIAVGEGREMAYAVSEKIGVLRMSERFVGSDPLSRRDEANLVEAVEQAVAPHLPRIQAAGFGAAVGTSGTILAVGALAHQWQHGKAAGSTHHLAVTAEAIGAARRRLVGSDLRARLRMGGLDEKRADIIVAGAVILDTLLQRLGVQELVLCDWALREGILLDYIHEHPRYLALAEAYPDVRRRSVLELAERCQYDAAHAHHVAGLSLALFDATRSRHGLDDAARPLLEYAALLHDVGHHISYVGHHRHSYYLIRNGDLRGFSPAEVEMIASVARYHRRSRPRKKHAALAAMSGDQLRSVRVLAGILRAADALDRSHRQAISGVSVSARGRSLTLRLEAAGDPELEVWGVRRRVDLLERTLDVRVRVEVRRREDRVRPFRRRVAGR